MGHRRNGLLVGSCDCGMETLIFFNYGRAGRNRAAANLRRGTVLHGITYLHAQLVGTCVDTLNKLGWLVIDSARVP
jgi:hypothetical protein